jgi:hypothetical protein
VAKKKALALSLGLALLLLSSGLLLFALEGLALASPDKLKWSIVDTPSEEDNVVLSPSEINAFVIGSDDETFYAIDIPGDPPGGKYPNGKVYKSIDGGITWDDSPTAALNAAGANLPGWGIALAPGDHKLVAVVTANRTAVYISDDGGESWVDSNVPDLGSCLIADISISQEYDGYRDIAIGTRNPGGVTNGDVWVMSVGGLSTWNAQGLNMDVSSVRFSTSYSSDKTVLVIASDTDKTYLCTGIRNTSENTTDWDAIDPGQVEISESSGESPGENEIIVSDLALPSDYSSRQASSRVIYAAYSSNTTADDVYRIEDAEVYRLDVKHGDKVAIASIAYYGARSGGKLLAGEVVGKAASASALVHTCFDPEGCPPKWEEPNEFKSPTGGAVSQRANALLAWSSDGETSYCGTSSNNVTSAADWADSAKWSGQPLDESAFSQSKDGGDTWNQLSLIDTQMSYLYDYALSVDIKGGEPLFCLYLASAGDDFDSIWRSESEILEELGEIWERILCPGQKGDIILRATPQESNKEVIFFAVVDTNDALYSLDKGQTWERVWDCPDITDLAVVNDEVFYILTDNLVSKSWWDRELWGGSWQWQRDVDTGLYSGYTIAISGGDFVFVGEDEYGECKIAYSTDGGATFNRTEAAPESGNMHVIPDEDFYSNRFIYAASDDSSSQIYRWTIGRSISWKELNPPDLGFYGLAQKGDALYGAYGPGVDRTLVPHQETVALSDWDSLEAGLASGVTFKPGTLQATSDEAIDLWAIDNHPYDFDAGTGCLWVYSDAFALQTPWPTSPVLGELIACDTCDCQARSFCFRWRQLASTEEYELWIALDEEFTAIIEKAKNITPDDPCDPAWCPLPGYPHFSCGKTYYWKVRSSRACESDGGEFIRSRWSPPMSFTVKTASSVKGMHIAPILEVPQSGSRDVSRSPSFSWIGFPDTTKYGFILAKDAELAEIIINEELPTSAYQYGSKLDWGTTYFWQVRALEPVPSEPVTNTFTVMLQPKPTATTPIPLPATPFWIWLIIGILASLNVVVIVFCFTRR